MLTKKSISMFEQWEYLKATTPDAILLFQLGDFFEAFYEDAKLIADKLNIVLTKRQDVPMAGIPVHQLENYIERLGQIGKSIAIAEQVNISSENGGIVDRKISRVITPGTAVEHTTKHPKENLFLSSIAYIENKYGIMFSDISTGEMACYEAGCLEQVFIMLTKNIPKEIVVSNTIPLCDYEVISCFCHKNQIQVSTNTNKPVSMQQVLEVLFSVFPRYTVQSLKFDKTNKCIGYAIYEGIKYINKTFSNALCLFKSIKINNTDTMFLPIETIYNLEILPNKSQKKNSISLLEFMDYTISPQGGRLFKHWVGAPLLSKTEILDRQAAIKYLRNNREIFSKVCAFLKDLPDFQRLLLKIVNNKFSPQDLYRILLGLKKSKEILCSIYVKDDPSVIHSKILNTIENIDDEIINIIKYLQSPPPSNISGEQLFLIKGTSEELDGLYLSQERERAKLYHYCESIKQRYNLKFVRTGQNKIYGVFLEISKTQINKLPKEEFYIVQTLINVIRVASEELLSLSMINSEIDEKILYIEQTFMDKFRNIVLTNIKSIQDVGESTGILDCIQSLTALYHTFNLTEPNFNDNKTIELKRSFHPIVASNINCRFVTNDILLSSSGTSCFLITGPNMAGKSTFIRQIGIIVIMAQIGSGVPAEYANLAIFRSVLTRIGADDNLTEGISTFMMEMMETTMIIRHASYNTLVIIDEIGRGTSPEEGEGIAYGLLQHLVSSESPPITLYSTHYHTITDIYHRFPHKILCKKFNVSINNSNTLTFHYTLTNGISKTSYAINTAKLAGIPENILNLATERISSQKQ